MFSCTINLSITVSIDAFDFGVFRFMSTRLAVTSKSAATATAASPAETASWQ